jgi:isopentenyl diphosphate isomerase/L-lactate dehydrogenase-like FMN-dependent dehydrogenase
MAGGESGVDHLTKLLRDDYTRTLKLLGVTGTAELDRDLVSLGNESRVIEATAGST